MPTIYVFFSKIRKIMCTPVIPSFTIYKWGLMGPKLYKRVFVMTKYMYFVLRPGDAKSTAEIPYQHSQAGQSLSRA